jgi:hypothetical protein
MGREQLRELLFGMWSGEAGWRDWCADVLAQTPALVEMLQREARRAFDLEGSTDQGLHRVGTDQPTYWHFLEVSPRFENWLDHRVRGGDLSGRKATTLRKLRVTRLVRLASLSALALDGSPASQEIVAMVFSSGCPKEQEVAATIVVRSEGGWQRLARLCEAASLEGLVALAQVARRQGSGGLGAEAAGLVEGLRARLMQLRFDPRTSREEWLIVACSLLEPSARVGLCLCEVGRRPDDSVRNTAYAQLAAVGGEARPVVLRAAERWVGALTAIGQDGAGAVSPRAEVVEWARGEMAAVEDPEDRIRLGAWSAVLSEELFEGPDELLEALAAVAAVASGAEASPILFGAEALPWVWCTPGNLLVLASWLCGEQSAPVLLRALRVGDPHYAAVAYEQMASLGSGAVACLLHELRTSEHPGWEVVSLLGRLRVQGIEDDLLRLLPTGDRLERREALAELSIRRDERVLPLVLQLAGSDDAGERNLAMFALFHLRSEEGLAGAIRCLADPVREVWRSAQLAVLAAQVPSRMEMLARAAREGPLLQRMTAIILIAQIGGAGALAALPDVAEAPELLRGHLESAHEALAARTPRRLQLPRLTWPSRTGRTLPNQGRYWLYVRDDPFLVEILDRYASGDGYMSDEEYLRLRKVCLTGDGSPLVWFM